MGSVWADTGLVVIEPTGEPVHPRCSPAGFKRWWPRRSCRPIRLHDLRHSYATAALAAGVPVEVVSERIGHPDVVVTLRVYQHTVPQQDADAAVLVASMILGS